MKLIPVQEAVGHVLCHDMTQIIPGQYKDARFRKGHVVREEDIPVLLAMGKENLYVWELVPGMVHENDAAGRLVRNGGRFALCHRPERLVDALSALRAHGLEPKRLKTVSHRPEHPPALILVEAVRQGRPGLTMERPAFFQA